ncbi:uncharacterized protein LOC121049883 isoform X2 [Rosa chinensis]|uniref:uncharacterized protein LOC121049883 isoform X2 n=1 Tax=Rosa chinensis TaxID=74649 RepID=UPI001AD91025|nr:uncharacterized protein LOC121049883 isoform X2 [Rosa chinensis]
MWSLRIWDFWRGGALESVSSEMGNGNRMNDDDGNAAMLNRISVEKKLWTRACAHGFGQMIESRERTQMWTSTPYPADPIYAQIWIFFFTLTLAVCYLALFDLW